MVSAIKIEIDLRKVARIIIFTALIIGLSLVTYGIALPASLCVLGIRYAYKKGKQKGREEVLQKRGDKLKVPLENDEGMKERDGVGRF